MLVWSVRCSTASTVRKRANRAPASRTGECRVCRPDGARMVGSPEAGPTASCTGFAGRDDYRQSYADVDYDGRRSHQLMRASDVGDLLVVTDRKADFFRRDRPGYCTKYI
jgi:hypothetical protein